MGILSGIVGSVAKTIGAAISGGSKSSGGKSSGGGGSKSGGSSGSSMNAYEQWRKNNPDYYVSSYDDSLARANSDAAASIMRNKAAYQKAYEAGDQEGMAAANKALNLDRERFGGYTAGTTGSEYNVSRPYTAVNTDETNMIQRNNDQARELYAALVKQGTDRLNAQKSNLNTSYDDNARQAYVSYMQGQRTMPQQLAALGVTGGAAESSLIGARSGYENNLNQVNTARQKALQDIDNAIIDLQNSGDVQTAQYILNNADKIADNYAKAAYADIARGDTLAEQLKQDARMDAALTGLYKGVPTYEAKQNEYNKAIELAVNIGNFSGMKQFGWSDEDIRIAYKNWLKQRGW